MPLIAHASDIIHRRSGAARWFVAALLLCLPVPLHAAVYYVAPTGNDASTGTSPGTAWATIGKANSRVAPGDVVNVAAGTYSQYPWPNVSGTATQRITYIGNLANPAAVSVSGSANLNRSYVTVKGFRLTGGFYVSGQQRDSIAWCKVEGSKPQLTNSNDCVIAFCDVTAQRFWVVGSESDTLATSRRDTISDCNMVLSPYDGGGHTIRFKMLDACVFVRTRFVIDIGDGAVGASCTKLFFVRNCKFVDSFWDITNRCTGSCDEAGWFANRDLTQSNLWLRDTIQTHGPGKVQFFGTNSGDNPGSVLNNTYDSCVFKFDAPCDYGYAIYYQDRAKFDTLRNCVIASSGGALEINGSAQGPMLIENNTFAGTNPWFGTVCLDAKPGSWFDQIAFRNNILYTFPWSSQTREHAALNSVPANVKDHLVANYNLFSTPWTPDDAIWCSVLSRPGTGYYWCRNALADSNSFTTTDPKFVDATSVLSFDAHLRAASPAIGAGLDGVTIGAYGFGTDATAPGAVSDLAIGQVGDILAVLTWHAPGDDGTRGTATSYDIRYSTQAITEANFAAATRVAGAPIPAVAGTLQTITVTGLTPGTRYYFALQAHDELNNVSPLSNVPNATTDASDRTAPAAVQDLKANP